MTLLNQYSYAILAAVLVLSLAAWLALTGVNRRKLAILLGSAIALTLIWAGLRPGPGQYQEAAQVELVIREARRPVLVEFYSEYCVGCLAAETTLDLLEAEFKDELSIVRLDIASAPGKQLSAKLSAHYTPTFILFDADGQEVWRGLGALDVAAVRHAVNKSRAEALNRPRGQAIRLLKKECHNL